MRAHAISLNFSKHQRSISRRNMCALWWHENFHLLLNLISQKQRVVREREMKKSTRGFNEIVLIATRYTKNLMDHVQCWMISMGNGNEEIRSIWCCNLQQFVRLIYLTCMQCCTHSWFNFLSFSLCSAHR